MALGSVLREAGEEGTVCDCIFLLLHRRQWYLPRSRDIGSELIVVSQWSGGGCMGAIGGRSGRGIAEESDKRNCSHLAECMV